MESLIRGSSLAASYPPRSAIPRPEAGVTWICKVVRENQGTHTNTASGQLIAALGDTDREIARE